MSIRRLRDNREVDYRKGYMESVDGFIKNRVGGSYVDAYLYSCIGYFLDDDGGMPVE